MCCRGLISVVNIIYVSLMDLYFPNFFVNSSLQTNVEKESYLGFIMTMKILSVIWEHVAQWILDTALDSRSEGLGIDSLCWPYVEVLGKLRIPRCLSPRSRNGYLVHRSKVGAIVAGCIGTHLARR